MRTETANFLEALIFANKETNEDLSGASIYDFHLDFINAADYFVYKFMEYLSDKGINGDDLETLERLFGCNVYFSLSGHGCGFWDDSSELGKIVNDHLIAFSGSQYRFEQMDIGKRRGKLDLAFKVKFVDKYRKAMFYEGLAI